MNSEFQFCTKLSFNLSFNIRINKFTFPAPLLKPIDRDKCLTDFAYDVLFGFIARSPAILTYFVSSSCTTFNQYFITLTPLPIST